MTALLDAYTSSAIAIIATHGITIAIGWWIRGSRNRYRLHTAPVFRADGTVAGYRTKLGRLSLGPLRENRGDADNHTEHLRGQL